MTEVARNVRQFKWNQKDLAQRLCHALDVAEHAVGRLAENGYSDLEEPGNDIRPEKVISETAFLLLAASTVPGYRDVTVRIDRIAHLLIPHARSERMLLKVCLHPSLALDFAQAHICLGRLGYRDERFDTLLRQSRRAQARLGRERVPHRMLEQEWIANSWEDSQIDSQWHPPATRFRSVLNHPVDLLGGTREDAYAFTHALMYVRDFNIHPLVLPRRRSELLAEAEAMLARCLDEQDYDLGGEMLLAWPLMGKSWSAAAAFGFRVLARVEDMAGFLPASSTRLDRFKRLEDKEGSKYLLATAYHTVYVMGLLCAVSLQPGRTPPIEFSANNIARGRATPILQILDSDAQKSHWREELEILSEEGRDAVAGLLLDIALLRSVNRRDFRKVRELLAIGDTLGLSDTPCSGQAAEILERLAIFARVTQVDRSIPDKGSESMTKLNPPNVLRTLQTPSMV